MTTDERILTCLENTLKKMDEISRQLSKIETSTDGLNQKQHQMEEHVVRLERITENNNIM